MGTYVQTQAPRRVSLSMQVSFDNSPANPEFPEKEGLFIKDRRVSALFAYANKEITQIG